MRRLAVVASTQPVTSRMMPVFPLGSAANVARTSPPNSAVTQVSDGRAAVLVFHGTRLIFCPIRMRPMTTRTAGQASAARQPHAMVTAALTTGPTNEGNSHIIAKRP